MQPGAPARFTVMSVPAKSAFRSTAILWVDGLNPASLKSMRFGATQDTVSPLAGLPVQPVEPRWKLKVLAAQVPGTPAGSVSSILANLRPDCQLQAMAWISKGLVAVA